MMTGSKRILLLLIGTLLMLACIDAANVIRGESRALGSNSVHARFLAVRDHETDTESEDDDSGKSGKGQSMESDDDDDDDDDDVSEESEDSPKGSKGGGSIDEDDDDSISSSKGSKGSGSDDEDDDHPMSEDTMPSAKGGGSIDDEADDHPMSSSKGQSKDGDDDHPMASSKGGKGKGKGGHSMDDDSVNGKGGSGSGKMSKKANTKAPTMKGSKKNSSTKAPTIKGSKKGSKKNNTMSPDPITPVPTSEDSFGVRPAPYGVFYTFEDNAAPDPTIDDFAQLAEVTRIFLSDYMENKYAQTSIIILDDFLTFLTRSDGESRPVAAVYRSVGRFNPRSIFYPPRSELEEEVEIAFTDPASQMMYLEALKKLPSSNVFSTVTSITYGEPLDSVPSGRTSGFAIAGIAAAAAGMVVLVAGITLLRRQRSRDDDDHNEKHKLNKNSAATVSSSTYASTAWRPSAEDANGLQDEPLEDYNNRRRHVSKLSTVY